MSRARVLMRTSFLGSRGPRYQEGVIVDGRVMLYDNEMVIRYLDRVVVNDQNYEVQLKGGVTITI